MLARRMEGSQRARSVVIVGAGAMGGVFGATLAEAGVGTAMLDTDDRLVAAIETGGVRLLAGDGERIVRVPVTADAASLEPPDAVVFFVKCHHTRAAAESVRGLVADGTRVVSLQNGWGNADVLAGVFGPERIVVGVTYTSATTVEPGTIRTSGPARTVVGALTGNRELAEPVAAALSAAGFAVEQPDEILTEVWKKLVLNAATLPTAALTGLTAGALAASPEMHELVDDAAAEAVAAGRARGFAVDLDERLEAIHATLARAGDGKGSMLQDVEAGRPTEIDVISGAVVRAAREHDLVVPVTRSLYALVTGLERARGQR
jgi:2-dehydropantoate 2-reductase